MDRIRIVAAVTIVVGMLVLTASPAFAAVETRVEFNNGTSSRGTTTIDPFVNCTDSETGSDVQTDATLTVTLTQGGRSVTRVEEFTCFGDDLVVFTFRGFHPGDAFFEGELTACAVNDPTDCDTSTVATEVTLVRG
jgi:hypothetical protein